MAIREGRWDCTSCSKVGILGRHKECPGCSRVRPEGVKFYLPEDAPVVTDKAQIEQAKNGPDWICDFCESSNAADAGSCSQCGGEKGAKKQKVRKFSLASIPRIGDITTDIVRAQTRKLQGTWRSIVKPEKPDCRRWVFPIVGVAIFAAAVVAYMFFSSYDVPVTVKGVTWLRTIDVEAYKTFVEEDWHVPSGGRQLSQRSAIHHYDRVLDHYDTKTRTVRVQTGTRQVRSGSRDLGNGYFEDVYSSEPVYENQTETYQDPVYRDDPVYRTKYSYEIDRWVVDRTRTANGADRHPEWPAFRIRGKKEREGKSHEEYHVHFQGIHDKDDIWKHKVNYDDWRKFDDGMPLIIVTNYFGQIQEVRFPEQ
jgi:hypothetical protein